MSDTMTCKAAAQAMSCSEPTARAWLIAAGYHEIQGPTPKRMVWRAKDVRELIESRRAGAMRAQAEDRLREAIDACRRGETGPSAMLITEAASLFARAVVAR